MKTLKTIFTAALIFAFHLGFSQTAGNPAANGYAVGAQNGNGVAIGSMLSNADPSVRMKKRVEEFAGSPYADEAFAYTTLYYGDEEQGEVLYRYNAFNEEIEIKESIDPEEPVRALLTDKSIKVMVDDLPMSFKTFIDKDNNTLNGYLITLYEGENYNLYRRINVKYSEGSPSPNSFVKATPNRFSHFTEYFIEKKGDNKIVELETKKRKLMKLMKDENKDDIKNYLSDNKVNLKDEDELVETIKYLDK